MIRPLIRGSVTAHITRLRVAVRGAVQGVGFRPFVYRLATGLGLDGWVNNSPQGVFIEVEGPRERVEEFLLRLSPEKPAPAYIQSIESSFLDPAGYDRFEIRESVTGGAMTTLILPDLATCPDCLLEIFDPTNRRYRYPFTNCTNCGPRFSIIQALPYDRPNTTMSRFPLCDRCRAEYDDPLDRRFHAQPNACPDCGPHLELWDTAGGALACNHVALIRAAEAIRHGSIVAVKGLGGFHLMVDARNEQAVQALRKAKNREEKPLAIMVQSLEWVEMNCVVNAIEARLLRSPESPIVLLKKQAHSKEIAPSVAPGNPSLGIMLPYTPLHHLLLAEICAPIVATSGNLSDEPICTDEREALHRLAGIADLLLVHNRPIERHVDDSIVVVILGREMVLRRARGYAPLPVTLEEELPAVLAVGAQLKNTVAIAAGKQVFVSQHIGDLEAEPALEAFRQVTADLQRIYELKPEAVACDLHPDYASSHYARRLGLPVLLVQHHHAHVLSCMAENDLDGPVLGVSWDGTGYGTDGTVWGGEFLRVSDEGFTRAAHLRTFPLPGGDRAVREPRRCALGLIHALYRGSVAGCAADLAPMLDFKPSEMRSLGRMMELRINSPLTSSAGRLFDAVASLVCLRHISRFEGQAAMDLEFALEGYDTDSPYSLTLISQENGPAIVDWEPLVLELLQDVRDGVPVGLISARFHNALIEGIIAVARHTREERVVLTGGCFQNRYLAVRAVHRLTAEGFRPYWHQRVPPNDGGIALGQVMAVARRYHHVPGSSGTDTDHT